MAPISAQGKRRARGRPHGPRGHTDKLPAGAGRAATRHARPRSSRCPEPAALREGPRAGVPRTHAPRCRAGPERASRPPPSFQRAPRSPGRPVGLGEEDVLGARGLGLGATGRRVGGRRSQAGTGARRTSSWDPLFGDTGEEEGDRDPRNDPAKKLWPLAPSLHPFFCLVCSPFVCDF